MEVMNISKKSLEVNDNEDLILNLLRPHPHWKYKLICQNIVFPIS